MTSRPASSSATVTVSSFNTSLPSGSILANFTANTTNGNNVNFTMSTLKPYYYYLIKKDGVNLSIQQADATGMISFSNSVWNSSSRFTVIEDASVPEGSAVTFEDLVTLGQHFGEKTSAPYPKYDYNKDGEVDILDVVYVTVRILK